jgi:polysaccharide biosynthesis protein PslH
VHFYVEPDVVAEAERVCALFHKPHDGLKIGAAARNHVARHYNWASQLASLDAIMGCDDARAEAAE